MSDAEKQASAPSMVAAARGAVINIASAAAHPSVSNGAVYATSKTAVAHHARCLAAGIIHHGVRANALSPDATKTARFQATRVIDFEKMDRTRRSPDCYAKPDEIANVLAFFATRSPPTRACA